MPQRKGAKQINDSGATVQEADHSGDIQEVEVDEIVYTEPI